MPSTYQVVPKTPLWLAVAIMAFRWSVVSKYQGTQVTQDGARTDTKAREVADKTSHRASILTATWVRARLLGKAELHARRMEAAAQPFLVQPRSDGRHAPQLSTVFTYTDEGHCYV